MGALQSYGFNPGRFKGIQENDRVMHEMRALMEVLEHGGCYDQLNLTSLACMESVGRRVQSIVDAYNSGSSTSPDGGSKDHLGLRWP